MKNKLLKFIEIGMIVIFLCIIIFYQSKHILWLDELDWSIGIVNTDSINDMSKTVLSTGENLPLFYIILFIVKNIFGYNQWILTLLTATIFTIIGSIGIIKISDKIFEKNKRIYTIFFLFFSYSIISQCGWQLRPYGVLFCCSSWMLYFYLERYNYFCNKNQIKYLISMILLMYSHWFGVLISLVYAFIDFILFLKKKLNWRFIIPYIVSGLVFLPAFIILMKCHKTDIISYGVEVPNFLSIILIFRFLGNNSFLNGFIIIVMIVILMLNKRKKDDNYIILKIISYIIFILIGITYIYSRFINPQGSIIRNRYFSVLLPHSIILLSYAAITVFNVLKKNRFFNQLFKTMIIFYLILELTISYIFIFHYPNHEGVSNYETWSKYLCMQQDIYDSSTLVICSYGKVWIDYYFTYKDKEMPRNLVVVDPLEFPNSQHMAEQELEDFRYFVKDGKYSNDSIMLDELKKYKKIYYLEEYRTISKSVSNIIFGKNYRYTRFDDINLYILEKINEE